MRSALMDSDSVPLELRSNYLRLSRNKDLHTGGDILDRNVDSTSRLITVQRLYGKPGKHFCPAGAMPITTRSYSVADTLSASSQRADYL
jgi:hypothetical protein